MTTKPSGIREKLHEIIFEAETLEGKAFDVALMITIILSVIAVLLESVAGVRARYSQGALRHLAARLRVVDDDTLHYRVLLAPLLRR